MIDDDVRPNDAAIEAWAPDYLQRVRQDAEQMAGSDREDVWYALQCLSELLSLEVERLSPARAR